MSMICSRDPHRAFLPKAVRLFSTRLSCGNHSGPGFRIWRDGITPALSGLFLTADLATRLSRIERREHDASDATRDVAMQQEAAAIGTVGLAYGRCFGNTGGYAAAEVLPAFPRQPVVG